MMISFFFRVMEHCWNEIDRGKPNYWKKNLSLCHSVHHKSHMDWSGSNLVLRGERPATNSLSHGTACDICWLPCCWNGQVQDLGQILTWIFKVIKYQISWELWKGVQGSMSVAECLYLQGYRVQWVWLSVCTYTVIWPCICVRVCVYVYSNQATGWTVEGTRCDSQQGQEAFSSDAHSRYALMARTVTTCLWVCVVIRR
jgi:hypothetical protein